MTERYLLKKSYWNRDVCYDIGSIIEKGVFNNEYYFNKSGNFPNSFGIWYKTIKDNPEVFELIKDNSLLTPAIKLASNIVSELNDELKPIDYNQFSQDCDKILKKSIQLWGAEPQKWQTVEELAELSEQLAKAIAVINRTIISINKYNRGKIDDAAIRLEIADCQITLADMEIIFGSAQKERVQQLKRLEKRLK